MLLRFAAVTFDPSQILGIAATLETDEENRGARLKKGVRVATFGDLARRRYTVHAASQSLSYHVRMR
jgi:hypothetical protein